MLPPDIIFLPEAMNHLDLNQITDILINPTPEGVA
jgi:hypothetical protein